MRTPVRVGGATELLDDGAEEEETLALLEVGGCPPPAVTQAWFVLPVVH
jgi:hypothetical protein